MLLIQSRLNHGPLHGISLTSSSAQATPPDFGRLDFDSGAPVSVGNLDFQSLFDADWRSQPSRIDRSFDALPTHEPTQGFPHDGENDPIEDFSPSHVAGPAQPEVGKRAIEDWPQIAGLPPVSGSSDIDIIHDHPSPADMDFIPDAVSSHLSGTRDRNADRYNAGPNPPLSSGTRGRDANRYNAGSNPPNRASGINRSDAGRETAGPNPSSTSSRSHAGLFAAFNRRQTRKESAPSPATVPAMDPNRIHLVLALLHLTSSTSPSISHPGEEMKMMKPFLGSLM